MLKRRIQALVHFNEAQIGFIPENGTTDALSIVQRLQAENRAKDKRMYICFVDLDKAFDRVPRRVMVWAMRKKDLPEILVNAVKYEQTETKVRVASGL